MKMMKPYFFRLFRETMIENEEEWVGEREREKGRLESSPETVDRSDRSIPICRNHQFFVLSSNFSFSVFSGSSSTERSRRRRRKTVRKRKRKEGEKKNDVPNERSRRSWSSSGPGVNCHTPLISIYFTLHRRLSSHLLWTFLKFLIESFSRILLAENNRGKQGVGRREEENSPSPSQSCNPETRTADPVPATDNNPVPVELVNQGYLLVLVSCALIIHRSTWKEGRRKGTEKDFFFFEFEVEKEGGGKGRTYTRVVMTASSFA